MTTDPFDDDHDDQVERTQLSWRRTALSLVAAGVLVAHLSAANVGTAALVVTLTGTAAVVGFVWLSQGRPVGAAGLGLALGVLLLGAVALTGIVTA